MFAIDPSQITPDVGVDVSDYQFEFLAYDPPTYLSMGENLYVDGMFIFDNHVNFTNIALAASSNPPQTFGIGVREGDAVLSTLDSHLVILTMDCVESATCYASYYYKASTPLYAVQVASGSTTRIIPEASFHTNINDFNAAANPAVYHNTTGSYVEVKTTKSGTTTITFLGGTYIYADMGTVRTISSLQIHKPNASAIPESIDIYVSNNPDNWGAPVKNNHVLIQSTDVETIDIADTDGRYVKVQVNNIGDANTVQLAEFNVNAESGVPADPWNTNQIIADAWVGYAAAIIIIIVAVAILILRALF